MAQTKLEKHKSAAGNFWVNLAVTSIFLLVVGLFIFTPNYTDSHSAPRQNESAAIGHLHSLNMLQTRYAASHPGEGFACELSLLEPDQKVNDQYNRPSAPLSGQWSGYKFQVVDCGAEPSGIVARYRAIAVPVKRGETGNRAFCSDQSGEVFYDPAGSASNCLAKRRPIL